MLELKYIVQTSAFWSILKKASVSHTCYRIRLKTKRATKPRARKIQHSF